MPRSHRRFELLITLVTLLAPGRMLAVSCTTQGQMAEAPRTALVDAARKLASAVQSGNTAAVKASTIPKVRDQFDPIAGTIEQAAPLHGRATITIDALYALDASDLKGDVEDTAFFCGVAASPVHVDITIPQLPQGKYALTLVHATGVQKPQQMAFLLQNNADWELAGLFIKPLLVAGHDSVWYWTKARAFNQKNQKWNAYFYYTTAAYLAAPVDFMTSANLDKLNQEAAGARPEVFTRRGAYGHHGRKPDRLGDRRTHRRFPRRTGPGGALYRDQYRRSGSHPSSEPRSDEGYARSTPRACARASMDCGSSPKPPATALRQ